MLPCNMQLVDSQCSVVWRKEWMVFVVMLAVLFVTNVGLKSCSIG